MNLPPDDQRRAYFGKQLADIDLEAVRQAMLCGVPLNSRADIERVLKNDATICSKSNPHAFENLRAAITMHFTVRDKAIKSMGREETHALIEEILIGLRKRTGMPAKRVPPK